MNNENSSPKPNTAKKDVNNSKNQSSYRKASTPFQESNKILSEEGVLSSMPNIQEPYVNKFSAYNNSPLRFEPFMNNLKTGNFAEYGSSSKKEFVAGASSQDVSNQNTPGKFNFDPILGQRDSSGVGAASNYINSFGVNNYPGRGGSNFESNRLNNSDRSNLYLTI